MSVGHRLVCAQVKSLTLDKWTCEQVISMYTMGNARARHVYEHSLPARDSDTRITDRTLEVCVRTHSSFLHMSRRSFVTNTSINDTSYANGNDPTATFDSCRAMKS